MEQLPSAAIAATAAKARRVPGRPPFDRIALLLQGGGALGSYQAGVIFALTLSGIYLGTLLRRTLPRHHPLNRPCSEPLTLHERAQT